MGWIRVRSRPGIFLGQAKTCPKFGHSLCSSCSLRSSTLKLRKPSEEHSSILETPVSPASQSAHWRSHFEPRRCETTRLRVLSRPALTPPKISNLFLSVGFLRFKESLLGDLRWKLRRWMHRRVTSIPKISAAESNFAAIGSPLPPIFSSLIGFQIGPVPWVSLGSLGF